MLCRGESKREGGWEKEGNSGEKRGRVWEIDKEGGERVWEIEKKGCV